MRIYTVMNVHTAIGKHEHLQYRFDVYRPPARVASYLLEDETHFSSDQSVDDCP